MHRPRHARSRVLPLLIGLLLVLGACGSDEAPGDASGTAAAPTDETQDGGQSPEPGQGTAEETAPGDAGATADAGDATATAGDCETDALEDPDLQDFYTGNTVSLVVQYSPGGGYDVDARTLQPFLEDALGTTVVVENKPGAGGLLAINSMVGNEADGLTATMMNGVGVATGYIAGGQGMQFDPLELAYLGRVGWSSRLLTTGAEGEFQTIDDVLAADRFRFAATGPGSAEFNEASLLIDVLGINGDIISGYDGAAETTLAVTRGDADGMTGVYEAQIQPVQNGDHTAVLVIGDEREEDIPDVPTLTELDLDDEDRAVIDAYLEILRLGRVAVMHPDTPPDRLSYMQQGFCVAMQDAVDALESAERAVAYGSGEEVAEIAQRVLGDPPPALRTVLEESAGG